MTMHTRHTIRVVHRLALTAAIAICVSARPAYAQTPAAPAAAQTAPDTGTPNDNKLTWTTTAGANFSFETGVTEQRSTQIVASIVGQDGPHRSLAFDGSALRASFGAQGVTQVIADSDELRATFKQQINGDWYFVARASYLRNGIQLVDYQYEQLAGIGFGVGKYAGDVPLWRLDIIPLAGAVQQQKNIAAVDGAAFTYGVLQEFIDQKIGRWSVNESFAFVQNSTTSQDHRLNFETTLNAAIVGPLSGQITFMYFKNAVVAAGAQTTDERLLAGIAIKLPMRKPAK